MRATFLLLLLAGCAWPADPFERPGMWRAGGVNDANLRAQLAPGGMAPARGAAAEVAVTRLLEGRVPPLPNPRTNAPAAATPAMPVGGGVNAPR